MKTFLDLLIRVAAAHRLTGLIVDDEITRPLRVKVSEQWPNSKAEYLVNCPRCVSVWVGLAVVFMPHWAAGALALSSGTLGAKWAADAVGSSVLIRRVM